MTSETGHAHRGDVRLGVQAWLDGCSGPPDLDRSEADHEAIVRMMLLDELERAPRSRAELRRRLARRLVPDDLAEQMLDRFAEVGLVDDAAFARAWVTSRQSGRGLSRTALSAELRRKGVGPDEIAAALTEIDAAEEEAAAATLVRRRSRSMSRLDHQTRTRRLVGMLARKGYSQGLALRVVREVLAEEAD